MLCVFVAVQISCRHLHRAVTGFHVFDELRQGPGPLVLILMPLVYGKLPQEILLILKAVNQDKTCQITLVIDIKSHDCIRIITDYLSDIFL